MAKSYLQTVLGDSPNAVWKLNETSGTFADATGNGLTATAHGTITRNVSTGFAGVGSGVSFGGTTSDFIDIPANALLRPSSALSLECWVNIASYGANQCFMGQTATGVDGIGFGVKTAGQILFGFNTNAGTDLCTGTTALGTGSWKHVILAGNGSTWNVYLNGVSDTNSSSASGISAPVSTFNIGIDNGTVLQMRSGGAICFAALYPSVLSASQALAHYNARNNVGGGVPTQKSPPGAVVAALAHERNLQRKLSGHSVAARHRLSYYYRRKTRR